MAQCSLRQRIQVNLNRVNIHFLITLLTNSLTMLVFKSQSFLVITLIHTVSASSSQQTIIRSVAPSRLTVEGMFLLLIYIGLLSPFILMD